MLHYGQWIELTIMVNKFKCLTGASCIVAVEICMSASLLSMLTKEAVGGRTHHVLSNQ